MMTYEQPQQQQLASILFYCVLIYRKGPTEKKIVMKCLLEAKLRNEAPITLIQHSNTLFSKKIADN